MPAMPRVNNKVTKIAYDILGIPENMQGKHSRRNKKRNKRLVYQETEHVR